MKLTLLCAALLLGAGVAVAQESPSPDAPPPPGAEAPPPPPSAEASPSPHGRDSGRMRRDGMTPPRPEKGFQLQMGEDTGLEVECGDETIADCVAAVQPLIDGVLAAGARGD